MDDENNKFKKECQERVRSYGDNNELIALGKKFSCETLLNQYSYNFSWMGRPIIQHPQDIMMMQELMWKIKPDLVIETGIAHGGSAIMYAGYMEMMGLKNSRVLAIDIDIREHNRREIEAHPMSSRITMIEGSSISEDIVNQVINFSKDYNKILVVLDSNHTHDHVLAELHAYAPLVSVGSYCVVFDTVVEDMPESAYPDRPWGRGANPKTAVWEYLKKSENFIIDKEIDYKLLATAAPDGYLRRVL